MLALLRVGLTADGLRLVSVVCFLDPVERPV